MVNPVNFGPLRPVDDRRFHANKAGDTGNGTAIRSSAGQAAEIASPQVPLAKLTNLARQLAESGPPVDYAKIAQISQAISQGRYKVDAQAVADAMLRFYAAGDND